MKFIKEEKAYITSIILLTLLIPLLLLMIIIIEEYTHDVDNTIQTIESEIIKSKTEDFENEIITISKETLHNITLEVITTKKALKDSRKHLKNQIQEKINKKQEDYKKDNILIETQIKSIESSNDPFKIEINYIITVTTNNSKTKITKENKKTIDITDKNYPVYDPLPTLKTGATINNNQIKFEEKLVEYIELENNTAYLNAKTSIIIRKCPYQDYTQHGNNNQTIRNCLHNHYYHNSHDGLCLLCRLENKTSCNHYGFETFIIPTKEYDKAPTSIDHVLLNDKTGIYDGNKIIINNTTILYLDNGHKTKYGL